MSRPTSVPVLDEIPGIDGLFVAAGFSGTGFKTASAVGAAMADLILKGPLPSSVILSEAKDVSRL
jgi:sarcosine oxidase